MGYRKGTLSVTWRIAGMVAAALLLAGPSAPAVPAHADPDCAPVQLVYARGTTEPGDLGAAVGDLLYRDLQATLPMDIDAYQVRYPANLLDPNSVGDGRTDLAAHLAEQSALCPQQQFILAGYSQGAVVVQTALLLPDLAGRISLILLFGDPLPALGWNVPGPYSDRAADYCAPGDPVCAGGLDPAAHLYYGNDIRSAAGLAASKL
ncbi:cutinase family protein [Nocardia stercoris]|uniref:Cutinase family protein n=1 Tax=Nocardia stercoris TaxID=2483361 RepID=A0A3M2L3R1_9NOCA|nr:cutinase family protein [Nocardia stercoris]RMI32181.1 cutinase family protein [Nocardia stercoris]